jgi:Family of unknown function (DUF6166)
MLRSSERESSQYRGSMSHGGPKVVREDSSGAVEVLGDTSFEWGIDSEAAGRLAFAVLADAFDDDTADALWTDFKFDVVLNLDDEWLLTMSELSSWIESYSDD